MRNLAIVVGLLMVALLLPSTAMAHTGPDPIRWTGSEMNQPEYWEARFGPGVTCTKTDWEDRGNVFPAVMAYRHVFKGGQWVNIYANKTWGYDPGHVHGRLHGQPKNFGISWVTICQKRVPPVKVLNRGGGNLIGPAGDPWYRGTAWYKGTKRAKATLKVNGNVVFSRKFGDRNPETRCTFRSGWRYILPNKRLVYTVVELGTNRTLYREVVRRTPAGYFGPLYRGFNTGVTCR